MLNLRSINDKFILNDMLPKLELYNFQVNEVVYKSGLSIKKSCEDNGIETITLTRSPTGHPTKLNPCKSSLAGISISLKIILWSIITPAFCHTSISTRSRRP